MLKPLEDKEIQYWLLLHRIASFGPSKLHTLLKLQPKLSDWFNETNPSNDLLDTLTRLKVKPHWDWDGVEKDLAFANNNESHIVTLYDDAYPAQLKQIASPPMVLFVQGSVSNLKTYQVAMVGSRHPTPTGQEKAFAFASGLADAGFTITSGLALGIDGMSHRGALSAKAKTIAVLGQGLPQIYPARHKSLAQDIVTHGGSVITEYSVDMPPTKQSFPRRNRIISGLSLGVLVVEATLKSGSLITAHFALEQGREVFAMPGSTDNPLAKGCHHLIRQGAKCVETLDHIIDEIQPMIPKEAVTKQKIINACKDNANYKEELSSQLKTILSHVGYECTPMDRVVERTGLTFEEISPLMSELELSGRVCLVAGGYIRI